MASALSALDHKRVSFPTVSFLTCFGTRSESKNFEYTTKSSSHGLYMKHVLRHLDSPHSVGSVFDMISESFTKDVDQSISQHMAPVYT